MTEIKDRYFTVDKLSVGEYKDKGSRFIAYVQKVQSDEDFDDFMNHVKGLHLKARHHCYAYRLKAGNKGSDIIERFNDDGEPSGTAGRPILNQLLKNELEDTACIVVRYFGGTKLGTSGLIQAYKAATKQSISENNIKESFLYSLIPVKFDYSIMGLLMDVIKNNGFEIFSTDFDANPSLEIRVRDSQKDIAIKKIMAGMLNRSIEDLDDDSKVEGLRFGTPQSMI